MAVQAAAAAALSKTGIATKLIAALAAVLAGGGFMITMLIGGIQSVFSYTVTSYSSSLSATVLQYTDMVTEYAEKYGIGDYVKLILCIMQVESGGNGLDPMQSSECGYNTKYPRTHNGIQDPEYSIECGVQYVKGCLDKAGVSDPEDTERLYLAVQGYNFGAGYISWAVSNYGVYSLENAREFSEIQKAKLGWSVYGDTDYATKVMNLYLAAYSESGGYIYPVPGYTTVSSGYGYRTDPITGVYSLHKGIDFPAPSGTSIVASASGEVVRSGWSSSYGYRIEIQHEDGYISAYSHCSALYVSVGQIVVQGETIAAVGTTGNSTGNHLHFEIWTSNKSETIDPMEVLSQILEA